MLVGREPESSRVESLVSGAREGRSGVLVLRGEAGIGKSALLARARELATGFTVVQGTGVESESELPFAARRQVLRPLLDGLAALPGPQAAALRGAFALTDEPVEDRFRVSLAALTPQELQIATLVGDGGSNKDSAAQLSLSPRTVEHHLHKVFTQLGISTRAELMKRGVAAAVTAGT